MEKNMASQLVANLRKANKKNILDVDLQVIFEPEEKIVKFHQWANGRKHFGVFKLSFYGEFYYLIFCDWNNNGIYYIIVLDSKRQGTLIEVHKVMTYQSKEIYLTWNYSPRKRDGKNDLRKEYYKKRFGDIDVKFPIPNDINEINTFLHNLITTVKNRQAADLMF